MSDVQRRLARLEAQLAAYASATPQHQRPHVVLFDAHAAPEDLEARDAFFAAQHQAVPCACGHTGCPEMDAPVIFLPSKEAPDQEGADDAEEL